MRPQAIILLSIIICLIGAVEAATIQGDVYEWSTLEPLNNVIVEINTVPSQSIVVKDGTYFFNIPPGNYTIESRYYKDNLLEYYSSDQITMVDEGDFVFDLIVFPALDVEEFFPGGNLSVEELFEDGAGPNEPLSTGRGVIAMIALGLLLAALYVSALKRRTARAEPIGEPIPDDLERLLSILVKAGGRMTQKDLRKELDLSEAKVSLMITDLESRGVLKKIKKGRGNVIIIKNEQP